VGKFSPALRSFRQRLGEVEALLKLCEPNLSGLEKRSKARKKDEALCRAALVLLCSHMEGFFEDLVQDILQFHELNGTEIVNLPLRVRIIQIWKHLELADSATDEKKWAGIQAIRSSNVANESLRCEVGTFNIDIHIRGFTTPGSKEVEKLLRSVGIDDVWDLVEKKNSGSRILKHSLDALVYRRHPIAHGNADAKATPDDVKQYLRDMRKLAKLFDDVIAESLLPCCVKGDPWSLIA
jgi:hypothetical protein